MKLAAITLLLMMASASSGRDLDARDFFLIERGMTADHVRNRVGKPHHRVRITCGARKGHQGTQQWLYLPSIKTIDPQLSVITFEDGQVSRIERLPHKASATHQMLDTESARRLSRGMSEAEIIARAGMPQRHASIGCERNGTREAKAKLYYPAVQGMMMITVVGGKVSDIEQLSTRRSH